MQYCDRSIIEKFASLLDIIIKIAVLSQCCALLIP